MKAQAATEYLVLVAVVLMIALVCVAILVWPTGSSKDVKQSQADINLGIGKIAFPELAQGLVVYYKFDEGTGDKAYNNAAPNLYDSTLVNGVGWTSGVRGKAVSFDRVDDYATFSPGSSTTCTFAAWIYPGVQAGGEQLGNIVGGSGIDNYPAIFLSNLFRIYDGVDWRGSTALTSGRWNHVAYTFDGSSKDLYMYLNGVQVYYGNSATYTNCNPSRLGVYNPPSTRLLNGSMDDLHYYKRILSATEIELLYKNPGYP